MGISREPRKRGSDYSWNQVLVRGVHRAVVNDKYPLQPSTMDIGYHVLNLNAPAGTPLFSDLPRTLHDYGFIGSMVALRSKLYLFDKNILILDDHDPDAIWKWKISPHHPLTIDLFHLDCVVFRGKIYVFRGSSHSFICEVFDPEHNTWSPIKSPPLGGGDEHIEVTPPVMADPKNKRIIVYFKSISEIYAYYPIADEWECVSVVEGFIGWSSREPLITIAKGIIYPFYPSMSKAFFTAYDLDTKQWLQVSPAPGFLHYFDNQSVTTRDYDALFHRGNSTLVLLSWAHQEFESTQPRISIVHVLQFIVEVVKINDTKEVLVSLSLRFLPKPILSTPTPRFLTVFLSLARLVVLQLQRAVDELPKFEDLQDGMVKVMHQY